ncbi:MAG: serine hydrolase [Candidatus Sericytochromatia bacterium]|nr:serine hydrolase [Candidatus Sericytochromatia bacterium]
MSAHGQDRAASLERLLRRARESDADQLVIWHGGRSLLDRQLGPVSGPIDTWSVTKSLSGLVLGPLLASGRIPSLDTPLTRWFPTLQGRGTRATLRHVLEHTSGLTCSDMVGPLNRSRDRVAKALGGGFRDEPGTVFTYNNEATALIAGIIARSSGMSADRWMQRVLFGPLGIRSWRWPKDQAGQPPTYSGLALTARDLARIGAMLAADGVWKGQRLYDASWIRSMMTPVGRYPSAGKLWWLLGETRSGSGRQAFMADGWLGQYLVVLPDEDLVAVRLRQRRGDDVLAARQRHSQEDFVEDVWRLATALR